MSVISKRYDFVLLFDVMNGNPNGDPDAGNLPRIDPDTYHGLVTDVCLKRKIRNYVELARAGQAGYGIYVQEGSVLNEKHREAYKALRPGDAKVEKESRLNPKGDEEAENLRMFMCSNFFDIRTFGAVMSTGINCGQVRGPVQFAFGRSVEPIVPQEISITRMAATSEKEKAEKQQDDTVERKDNRTMGRKHIVPYGLYRAHGFISAKLADRTGFSDDDREVLFEALKNMFEHDRSAARGQMATRKLIVFCHENALGNAAAHELFDRVQVGRNLDGHYTDIGVETANLQPARKFSDYLVLLDKTNMPKGVEVIELV